MPQRRRSSATCSSGWLPPPGQGHPGQATAIASAQQDRKRIEHGIHGKNPLIPRALDRRTKAEFCISGRLLTRKAGNRLQQSKRPGEPAQPGHRDMFVALNLNLLSRKRQGERPGPAGQFFRTP